MVWHLDDPVDHAVGGLGGAEGVDDVAEDEGHERLRHPVGHRGEGAHGHEQGVRPVGEREEPVQRHAPGRRCGRRRLPRASYHPSSSSSIAGGGGVISIKFSPLPPPPLHVVVNDELKEGADDEN